jgi:hypothetical protein
MIYSVSIDSTIVTKMETIDKIPVTLYKTLSDKLVSLILNAEGRNAISSETSKKIIYLWRQNQLDSPSGIETLLSAGFKVDQSAVEHILDNLGLQEVTVEILSL